MSMPQVNLSPELYERLRKLAQAQGCSTDALVDQVLAESLSAQSLEDWKLEFREMRETIQAQLPPGITDEEIDADIEAARQAVWEERASARSR